MPLTEAQRTALTGLDEQKQAVENAVHQYNRLLRMVRDWDAGVASFLIPEGMTEAQVIATARAKLNAQRLLIIAAAEAIRVI